MADELVVPQYLDGEGVEGCSYTAALVSLLSVQQELLVEIAVGVGASAQVAAQEELEKPLPAPIPQTTLSQTYGVCSLRYSSQVWSYSPSRGFSPARQDPISAILMALSRIFRRYHHPPISAATE